jgi:hypothetical protein
MKLNQIATAERNAIEWLINAFSHGHGGFPHSRWMHLPTAFAWNKDYAETTGYLLENLLEYNADVHPGLSKIAISAGDWLVRVQSKEGYYHSGIKFKKSSAFNTAQVLFGLDTLYMHTQNNKYMDALSKSYNWLINSIDENGLLRKGLYVEGYYPAYYLRALWPLIMIDQKYFDSKNKNSLLKSLEHLFATKYRSGFFADCGFFPGKPAILHAVVYTLEGFYECSKLMGREDIKTSILQILDGICLIIRHQHKTPAYLNDDFEADFSFICVSGQAQLCALLLKVYLDFGNFVYKESADLLFKQLVHWQIKSNSKEHNGAFPSSLPVWKNYFPFRYTNWTMKFFLDACWLMKKTL